MTKVFIALLIFLLIKTNSYQQILSPQQPDFSQNENVDSSGASFSGITESKPVNCGGKKRYLTKIAGDNGVFIDGSSFAYNAGDTLVLTASQNPYSYVTLQYFKKGTSACPLVVTNEGGQVILTNYNGEAIPGGFTFLGCEHVKVTGTGYSNIKYGFKITTPDNRGVGIEVYGRSAYFEIDHLDIYNKGAGMWIKHEADCADSLQFPHWVLHDFNIHDNYIHNCQQEGMYLGSTDPNGTRGVVCNGDSIYPIPMRLGNFHIYNNSIDSTGRGAIQLSGADSGYNEINNNVTTHIGYEYNIYQGNGVVLGGYTHAYVHNNTVNHTYSTGIYSLGAGWVRIINNTIDNSGNLNGNSANGMASIMIDTRQTTNPSPGRPNPVMLTFNVKNNKCGSNTDFNVRVYNTYLTFSNENTICNNVSTTGGGASKATYAVPNNVDYSSSCITTSVASNVSVSNLSIAKSNRLFVFPNPATDILNVMLSANISGKTQLCIYDEQGRLLQTQTLFLNGSQTQIPVNVKSLGSGVYNLQVISNSSKTNLKFIKAN